MNDIKEKTIGEIVAEDYRQAAICKKHGIDFCCNGNRTLSEVALDRNISLDELIKEMDNVRNEDQSDPADFQSWSPDLLADYIEKKHHRYVEERIPVLKQFLEKLCTVHGSNHSELFEITRHFNNSAGELTAHMKKEEFILFPYVRKMVKVEKEVGTISKSHFETVRNPINMMMQEHENEGERFRLISHLSNNYTPPEDACNTYKVTYAMLKEFEDDLHLHIHLENNILFPKAIQLEKEVLSVNG